MCHLWNIVAGKWADLLQGRLQKRLEALDLEARISPLPPVVISGILIVPKGLVSTMAGDADTQTADVTGIYPPLNTQAAAARARAVVMSVEKELGFEPVDRELEKS